MLCYGSRRLNPHPGRAIAESWAITASVDIWGSGGSKQTATCQRAELRAGEVCVVGSAYPGGPTRSGPRSTQPQIPPSGPARTTFGAPNPFSCPQGEAGPLPGPGLSPPPERAPSHASPPDPPPGSHGDACSLTQRHRGRWATGHTAASLPQGECCLEGEGPGRWQPGSHRPREGGWGQEGGSQCPLTSAWTQTGGVATPSSRLLGVGHHVLPELSLFAKVLGKGRLLPKLPL